MENKTYGFVEVEKHKEFKQPIATYELFSHRTGGLTYLLALLLPQILGVFALMIIAIFAEENSDPYLFWAYFITQAIMAAAIVVSTDFKLKKACTRMHFGKAVKKSDYLLMIPMSIVLVLGLNFIASIFIALLEEFGYVMQEVPFPDTTTFGGFIAGFFCICVMPAIVEESIFRGVILRSFSQKNMWKGIVISSALFSLMHGSAQQTAYQFVVGAILALVAIKTNSIIPSVILHMLNNAVSLVLMFFSYDMQVTILTYSAFPAFLAVCGFVYYFYKRETPFIAEEEEHIASNGSITMKDENGNVIGMSRDISASREVIKKGKKYQATIFYSSAIAFGIFTWVTMLYLGY